MSNSGTSWLQLVAATAVGAAVSYVVTREIDKRYVGKGESKKEISENPEERLIAMLEEMDE